VIEPGEVPEAESCLTDLDRYWHLKVCRWSTSRPARVFAERPDEAHAASRERIEDCLETGSATAVLSVLTEMLARCTDDQQRINVGAYEIENLANLRPDIYAAVVPALDGSPENRQAISVVQIWSGD
jgi:hypothetical protein